MTVGLYMRLTPGYRGPLNTWFVQMPSTTLGTIIYVLLLAVKRQEPATPSLALRLLGVLVP